MKEQILKINKWIIAVTLMLSLLFSVGIGAHAEENYGENAQESGENTDVTPTDNEENGEAVELLPENDEKGGEIAGNVFEEIYSAAEANADKIFSILAFIGTLVVGVGYKSGLLPMLRDALSRLKSAIDGVKADGEINKDLTESKMNEISLAVESISRSLCEMEYHVDNYSQLLAERRTMRAVLQGQIDMLYAIFMSSALPQYQKDEIGIKIQEMREELASYENTVEE